MHSSKAAKEHTKLTEIGQGKKMMSRMVKLSLSSVDPQRPVSQVLLTERKQELNAVLMFQNYFKLCLKTIALISPWSFVSACNHCSLP